MSEKCPICGHHSLGSIGSKRYFCSECCHELILTKTKSVCYYPGADGDMRRAGFVIDVAKSYKYAHQKSS